MPYTVSLGTPKPFWDAVHRPSAFIQFAAMEGGEDETEAENAFA